MPCGMPMKTMIIYFKIRSENELKIADVIAEESFDVVLVLRIV